jgi:quinol-cytochrome oxidoreductase complex cytochrome b subunit
MKSPRDILAARRADIAAAPDVNALGTPLYERTVPAFARRFWYCFGGLTFLTAVLQGLSGAFLAMYYQPTPERAYASVFYIDNYVRYGWLIRSAHAWGSQLMVVLMLVHMIRVYATASYKHPREFNWVAGTLLFLVTMMFSLTGSLLPWDQTAYWSSTVTVSLMEQIPIIGDWVARLLVGADRIGAPALSRFFSAHTVILPALLVALLYAHFRMVRRHGISRAL